MVGSCVYGSRLRAEYREVVVELRKVSCFKRPHCRYEEYARTHETDREAHAGGPDAGKGIGDESFAACRSVIEPGHAAKAHRARP